MASFYIFRHGETHATWTKTPYGEAVVSAEIIVEGIPAIKNTANYLKQVPSSFNASSELLRCRQTVEIVSEATGKIFVFDRRLNELINESFDVFKNRVMDFLKEIEIKNYENILVCTHGAVIAALKHLITKKRVEASELSDFPEPGVLTLIKDKKVQEINFNK